MKLWLPAAAAVLLVAAYLLYYELGATEGQGGASLGLANAAGLAAVIVGIIAAAFILRRGGPPPGGSPESRNP